MSLGVKGGAVLYRREQKTRKVEDYRKYMEKLVGGSVTAPDGKDGEEKLWWTEDSPAVDDGEKSHG